MRTLALVVSVVMAGASLAQADVLTIRTDVDTYLRQQAPTAVYPTSNLLIGEDTTSLTANAVFAFDIPAVLSGKTIQSVTLTLTANSANAGARGGTFEVYELRRVFSEAYASWTNYSRVGVAGDMLPWTTPGAGSTTEDRYNTLLSSLSPTTTEIRSASSVYDFVGNSSFASAVSGKAGNTLYLIVQLAADELTDSDVTQMRIYSGEVATESYRPTLTVNYVPEPVSMALLGLGGLGLLTRRRK
ncbi:MAG TPA: DNRLRE domain-containing protein [Phycisphaerae bacterium]|nr:DNRLRE domain-containing protein [Phycisphaerae bacterium]